MAKDSQMRQRLTNLKERLKQENPILSQVVDSFQELDYISRRLGFFDDGQSHATLTSWWPLISILGIYSSGKSTFINHYLQYPLQVTGNQAQGSGEGYIHPHGVGDHRIFTHCSDL